MSADLVSVVIPSYNSAQWILRAVDSARNQKNVCEIIVVDDCSSDDTRQVLDGYIRTGEIVYLRNTTNLGVASSRNKGVQAARGAYIAFLDADDWWAEKKLEKQLQYMKEHSLEFCYTGRKLFDHKGEATGRSISVRSKVNYKQLLLHNDIACSSVVVKRELALQVPMEHSEIHEDYLTWLRMLKKCDAAGGLDEPLLCYRLSKQGKSRNKAQSARMTFGVYRILGYGRICAFAFMTSHLLHGILKYHRLEAKIT